MVLTKKDFSYNFDVKPKKKYSRKYYLCRTDDVWITVEIPTTSQKINLKQ